MAILWCGGEDIDFEVIDLDSISESDAYRRSNYSRCSFQVASSSTGYSYPFQGGEITSAWVSSQLYRTMATGVRIFGLGKKVEGVLKGIYVGCNNEKIELYTHDGTTSTLLVQESGGSFTTNIMHKIDLCISNYNDTINGNAKIYIDGILVIDYTGDLTVSGVSALDRFCIKAGKYIYCSEFIVANTDTRNLSLVTNYPNAEGGQSDWTGFYRNIDESLADDADLIYDNTDGHRSMFGLSNLPEGQFSILCVKEVARICRSSDSTPTKIRMGISGEAEISGEYSLDTVWRSYERYMAINPVTSSSFISGEINNMQFVIESEA